MKEPSVPTLDLNALVHSHYVSPQAILSPLVIIFSAFSDRGCLCFQGASYTTCALCDNETEYMGIQ
jgi:hypothetical protein